jgi:exodeoxyribonuclease VII large subunit
MKVRIFGYLDFYAPNGRIGLKMTDIDPRYTLGDIAQSRDAVMRRLVAEGLLDANGRLHLCELPLRVGVVTSVGTAAWHDFRDELERSGFGFDLRVVDVRVQGSGAAQMVASAIAALGRKASLDAIVVIRGGGARNELAVFDAEEIARAIAAAPVPTLTGLGHEVDRSVADEVAHTAAKTPTACARLLIDRVASTCAGAEQTWLAVARRGTALLEQRRADLTDRAHRIARRTHAAVERADERLSVRIDHLAAAGPSALRTAEQRLASSTSRLLDRRFRRLDEATARTDVLQARVEAVDPAVQLARGWSITRRPDGSVIRHVGDLTAGDQLLTTMIDGTVRSDVRTVLADSPSADRSPTRPPTRRDPHDG